MMSFQVLKRMFIPSALLINNQKDQQDCSSNTSTCPAKDLPIYCSDEQIQQSQSQDELCEEPSSLEKLISTIRKSTSNKIDAVKSYEKQCEDFVDNGKNQIQQYVDFLQEENNTTPKYGAIAVGGVSGVILGLRGGWFKRTIYGTTGALIMAAVCYPKEAKEYSREVIKTGQEYTTIAYNFINGSENNGILTDMASYINSLKKSLGMSTSDSDANDLEKVRSSQDDCICPGIKAPKRHSHPTSTKEATITNECLLNENESIKDDVVHHSKHKTDLKQILEKEDIVEEECSECDEKKANHPHCIPTSDDIITNPKVEMSSISSKRNKASNDEECYTVCPGGKVEEEKTEKVKAHKKKCKKKNMQNDGECFSIC